MVLASSQTYFMTHYVFTDICWAVRKAASEIQFFTLFMFAPLLELARCLGTATATLRQYREHITGNRDVSKVVRCLLTKHLHPLWKQSQVAAHSYELIQ